VNLDRGSFTGDTEGNVETALETGISISRNPARNLEGVSFTRVFERWMKEAVGVDCLSLRELCKGNLEMGLYYLGPWKICRKGFGDGHSFHKGPVGERGRGLV
jgi:hypothetical protein